VRRRKELSALIEWVFNSSRGTYGYRRVHAALARRGVETSPDTVRSVMREQGLEAAQPRRKVRTTVPAADLGSRPDLVRRSFTASQPGVKWWVISRISAPGRGSCTWRPFWTAARRKQSGTRLGRQHAAPTPLCEAIDMAARRCPYTTGETIFHSDRGCQYTSEQLSQHLGRYEIIASTGRTGVCWDNAWAESFNATLKNERVYQMVYPTRSKAIRDIASWIELEHTIRNDSTPPWGTGRPTRSRRSTEQ